MITFEPIYGRLARSEELYILLEHKLKEPSLSITSSIEMLSGGCGFEIKANGVEAFRIDLGLVFSECVHHLRSALDNIIFALARQQRDPPQHPRVLKFPIYDNEASFAKETKAIISQLPERAAQLLKACQPFSTGDNALTLLAESSNADKHRIPLLVTMEQSSVRSDQFAISFCTEQDAENSDPNAMIFTVPLRENEVFLRWQTAGPIRSIDYDFAFECKLIIWLFDRSFDPLELIRGWIFYVRSICDGLIETLDQS